MRKRSDVRLIMMRKMRMRISCAMNLKEAFFLLNQQNVLDSVMVNRIWAETGLTFFCEQIKKQSNLNRKYQDKIGAP